MVSWSILGRFEASRGPRKPPRERETARCSQGRVDGVTVACDVDTIDANFKFGKFREKH